jgi:hypothetical protein
VQTTRRIFEDQHEWNLGHMVNVSERYAVGGVLSAGTNGKRFLGVKGRGRRWLSERLSLEIDVGWLRRKSYSHRATANSVTLAARLNIRDQGVCYILWDGVSLPESPYQGFQQAFSVGAGLGSKPALIGTAAGGLLFAIAWLSVGE